MCWRLPLDYLTFYLSKVFQNNSLSVDFVWFQLGNTVTLVENILVLVHNKRNNGKPYSSTPFTFVCTKILTRHKSIPAVVLRLTSKTAGFLRTGTKLLIVRKFGEQRRLNRIENLPHCLGVVFHRLRLNFCLSHQERTSPVDRVTKQNIT